MQRRPVAFGFPVRVLVVDWICAHVVVGAAAFHRVDAQEPGRGRAVEPHPHDPTPPIKHRRRLFVACPDGPATRSTRSSSAETTPLAGGAKQNMGCRGGSRPHGPVTAATGSCPEMATKLLQYDFGDGPVVDGARTVLFCA